MVKALIIVLVSSASNGPYYGNEKETSIIQQFYMVNTLGYTLDEETFTKKER
jgi:hypothetical protein